ncbi:MAG: YhgE/Pip domain-containing protein [Eggerthellales bacterium]|nr:YhgE/Pip domain-containing protein [Eggerthellales bacterium]
MRRIAKIFSLEMKALFSNVVTVIITIGLALMPSLFTWYNVLSCWDVFENTGEISVAVASDDEGYKSELFPLKVNVGEQVISALRANDQINWVFTTTDDAVDGAQAGRYYAAVIIPEGFSRAMLTFYQDEGERAPLVYYTNEKKNAIAPKITSQGADGVSYQVNKVFAETLADISLNIAQSVSQYLDSADVQSRVAALAQDVDAMGSRVDQTASVMGMYLTLAYSAQTVLDGTSDMTAVARQSASKVSDIAQDGLGQAQSTMQVLNASLDTVSAAIQRTIASLDELISQAPSFDDLPQTEETVASLRAQADALNVPLEQYRAMRDALAQEDEEGNAAAIAALDASIEEVRGLQKSLNDTADAIEAGNVPIDPELTIARAQLAKKALEDLQAVIDGTLRPKVAEVAAALSQLSSSTMALSAALTASADNLAAGLSTAEGSMGNAAFTLGTVVGKLNQVSGMLHGLSDTIMDALATEDVSEIRNLLGSNLEVLSSALAAPVGMERHTLYAADNFGSSMTPLYATIGMFVGALLILVGVKPRPSAQVIEKASGVGPIKPRHEFLGHFGVCTFISLLQSTILALGNMFFLQVQVVHPLLFLLCYWVSSLVFTFFIYAMVAAFANLGKAVAVILLIVQVTGCNGSFPLQLLPGFVQAISPFLPATHVVGAMREAMFGTFGTVFWEQMALVAVWIVPALLIGLVLRKPFAAFMTWYVEKVESSKLMA